MIMTADEFVSRAMALLSNDPLDRISDQVSQLVLQPATLLDTHMHIFDKNCVARNYLLIRMHGNIDPDKKLDEVLDVFISKREDDNEFDQLFKRMEFKKGKRLVTKLNTLEINLIRVSKKHWID